MTPNARNNPAASGTDSPQEPARRSVRITVLLVGVLALGVVIALKNLRPNGDQTGTQASQASTAGQRAGEGARDWTPPRPPKIAVSDPNSPDSQASTAPLTAPAVAVPVAPRAEPTPYTRQLVSSLAQFDPNQKEITAEQAAAWKQKMQQLIERGAEAIPAIREFFEQNKDVKFDALQGGSQMGASSLRLAMIDALAAIGGQAGIDGSLAVLAGGLSPRELERVAQNLEQQAPEQYRQQAVGAARAALAAAAASGKADGEDVGPLFRVIQQYGGPDAVADLTKLSERWKYYGTIALANMPDGAGIPALMQMVQDPNNPAKANRNAALQVLAQVAPQSPEAAALLLDQAKASQIPYSTWITIASVLSGHQFQIGVMTPDAAAANPDAANRRSWHLAYGNQSFYSTSGVGTLTEEQINQHAALIDQFIAATENPQVKDLLQQSRTTLVNRGRPVPMPANPAPPSH